MNHVRLNRCALSLALLIGVGGLAAAQSDAPAASLLPESAPIVLEIPEPARQLGEFHQYLERIGFYESPAWEALQKNPGWAQARVGVFGVAGAAGMTPWEAIQALAGDDLAMALLPRPNAQPGDEPRLLAIAHISSDHAARVDQLLEQLNTIANVGAESIENLENGRIIRVNPELSYGRTGPYLIVGNEPEHVKAAVERGANGGGLVTRSLGPADARANLRVDLAALRQPGGPLATPQPMNNALGGYLFGGWAAALVQGDLLNGWLSSNSDGVAVEMQVDLEEPVEAPFSSFFQDQRSVSSWRAQDLPRALGEIRVDRDWSRLFADREQLLTLEAANGVANFSAGLTTLMGGLDFMDELLPRVTGPVRLVAARQDFSDMERLPSPKLPAFALAIPLDLGDDDSLRDRLHSAAMGTLTLISFDQGQKQQPQLMTRMGTHKHHQVIYANYSAPMPPEQHQQNSAGDVLAVQYNFEPAVAIVGDELVVASTYGLVRDIIDLKEAGAVEPPNPTHDALWLDGAAAREALRINTEELIINRMLEQNESREQATAMFEGLFQALQLIESAEIVSRATDEGVSVTLSLRLNDSTVGN